jgi:hypothetical protein
MPFNSRLLSGKDDAQEHNAVAPDSRVPGYLKIGVLVAIVAALHVMSILRPISWAALGWLTYPLLFVVLVGCGLIPIVASPAYELVFQAAHSLPHPPLIVVAGIGWALGEGSLYVLGLPRRKGPTRRSVWLPLLLFILALVPILGIDIASYIAGRRNLKLMYYLVPVVVGRCLRVAAIVWLASSGISINTLIAPFKGVMTMSWPMAHDVSTAFWLLVGMFLSLLLMDMAYRFQVSGRLEPFFNSLGVFALDFTVILLLSAVAIRVAFGRDVEVPPIALLAEIGLFVVVIIGGAARVQLRRLTENRLEELLSQELADPAHLEVVSQVGKELLDVEVFAAGEGQVGPATRAGLWIGQRANTLAKISGNDMRRDLFIRYLQKTGLLRQGSRLSGRDMLLPPDLQRPYFWVAVVAAGLTVILFFIMVFELVNALPTHIGLGPGMRAH